MKSAGARRVVERSQQRAADAARGVGRALIRVSAGRACDLAFADTRRLPAQINNNVLQDGSGDMLYLPGYSQAGGPDVGS